MKDGEHIVVYSNERYDMEYIVADDYRYLNQYILHDGYSLFVVGATYAKQLKPANYYVVAKHEKQAREIFKRRHGDILSVISYVNLVPNEEAEPILKTPLEVKRVVI